MPIITRDQIAAMVNLLLFGCLGIMFYHLFSEFGGLKKLPENLYKQKRVNISLKGAMSGHGKIRVKSNQSIWQVVTKDNQWQYYINWEKIPLSLKVYEGMEMTIPFRKLRPGEKIPFNKILLSNGKLLQVVPCLKAKQPTFDFMQNLKRPTMKTWLSKMKNQKTKNCLQKYVFDF